jgi:hypothetical protein
VSTEHWQLLQCDKLLYSVINKEGKVSAKDK